MHEVIFDYKLPERCNDGDFSDVLRLTRDKLKASGSRSMWPVAGEASVSPMQQELCWFFFHLEGWERKWAEKTQKFSLHQGVWCHVRIFQCRFLCLFFGGVAESARYFVEGIKEIKRGKYQVNKSGIGLLQDSTVIACRVDVWWLGVGLDHFVTLFFFWWLLSYSSRTLLGNLHENCCSCDYVGLLVPNIVTMRGLKKKVPGTCQLLVPYFRRRFCGEKKKLHNVTTGCQAPDLSVADL